MSDITIRAARENEIQIVSDFVCLHFNGFEPIQLYHVRKDEEMDPPPLDLMKESVETETLLLAHSGEILVGVMIAGVITSEVMDQDLSYTKDFGPKGVDVFEFLAYIGEKADLCNRMKVPRSLHIHIVSVHSGHQRKGIAKKLFEQCIEIGKRRGYPAVSVDATSAYTGKIAESLGLQCVSTVTYDEYNEFLGRILFRAVEPHHEIKTFVMLYDKQN